MNKSKFILIDLLGTLGSVRLDNLVTAPNLTRNHTLASVEPIYFRISSNMGVSDLNLEVNASFIGTNFIVTQT